MHDAAGFVQPTLMADADGLIPAAWDSKDAFLKYIKKSHTEGKKLLKYIMVRRPRCGRGLSAFGFRAAFRRQPLLPVILEYRVLFRCFCQGTHTVCRPCRNTTSTSSLRSSFPSPKPRTACPSTTAACRCFLACGHCCASVESCAGRHVAPRHTGSCWNLHRHFQPRARSCFQPHTRSCSLLLPVSSADCFLLRSRVRSGPPTQSPPMWPRLPMCVPSRTASLLQQM